MYINCHLGPQQRVIRNSHIASILSGCQVSGFGYFWLPRRNINGFFSWRPNWADFFISFYFMYFFIYLCIYLYVFGGGEWGVGAGWSGWIGFGGNKSSKQCQIELKFWLRVVLMVVQILFKGFWKDPIFTENFYSSFWVFGLTLTSIYLLKMIKTNNSHQVIQINQNQGLIFLQFSVKTVITFCSFLFFFGYKWAKMKWSSRGPLFQKLLIKC